MSDGLERLLGSLGLTEYESRVLGVLFKRKEAEAPEISIAAGVPKTRVYDVLERLKDRQLIILISGRPKIYRVVEAKKVIDKLLSDKTEELERIKSEAEKVKSLLSQKHDTDYSEKIIKVKDRRDFHKVLAQELELAKESIKGFSSLSEGDATIVKDSLGKALDRNVNVMLIPGKSGGHCKTFSELNSKGISLKDYDHDLNAYIVDKNKVILGITSLGDDKPEYHFTIWRDNPAMAEIIGSHFDNVWKKASNCIHAK